MPGRHLLAPRGVECVAYRVAAKDARLLTEASGPGVAQRLTGLNLTHRLPPSAPSYPELVLVRSLSFYFHLFQIHKKSELMIDLSLPSFSRLAPAHSLYRGMAIAGEGNSPG